MGLQFVQLRSDGPPPQPPPKKTSLRRTDSCIFTLLCQYIVIYYRCIQVEKPDKYPLEKSPLNISFALLRLNPVLGGKDECQNLQRSPKLAKPL